MASIIRAAVSFLASACMTVWAQDAGDAAYVASQSLQRDQIKSALLDRYRMIDETLVDLKPLADYLISSTTQSNASDSLRFMDTNTIPRPLPNWILLTGKIIQILDKRSLLLSKEGFDGGTTIVRLRGYPYCGNHIDGDQIIEFVTSEGSFSYVTVQGANATIQSYYYGFAPSSDEVQARQMLERLKLRAGTEDEQRLAELLLERALLVRNEATNDTDKAAANARFTDITAEVAVIQNRMANATKAKQVEKRNALNAKVVVFKKAQASNNVAYCQYDLGRLYLKGDGVESNRQLALYWITRASTNGDPDAIKFLSHLAHGDAPK